MSKILLTGAGGLIGSHLFPLLNGEHEVFTISRQKKGKNNFRIDFGSEWDTDILPKDLDVIIHLAQSESFRDFPRNSIEIFNVNIASTLKLIDFAHKTGVKTFIFASSGGIYGNSDFAIDEATDVVYKNEIGFYLGSKLCSEIILENYSSLLQVIQLRLFFIYGSGQRKDMLVPRLVENIRQGRPIYLQGSCGIRINPCHAKDAAKAIEASLNLIGSDKINIAGPEVLTIKEMAEIIGKVTQREPQFIIEERDPKNLVGRISKMSEKLAKPLIKFQNGIRDLI